MKQFFIIFMLSVMMSLSVTGAYWNTSFSEAKCVTITNSGVETFPRNTTLNFTFDTSSLISTGKMNADCSDIRLIYNGSTETPWTMGAEDFGRIGCNNANSVIAFKTLNEIPIGTDANYCVYYKNPSATSTKGTNITAYNMFHEELNLHVECDDFSSNDYQYLSEPYDTSISGDMLHFKAAPIEFTGFLRLSSEAPMTCDFPPDIASFPAVAGIFVIQNITPSVSYDVYDEINNNLYSSGTPVSCVNTIITKFHVATEVCNTGHYVNISAWRHPVAGSDAYSVGGAFSPPPANIAPLMAFSLPVSPVLLNFGSNVTNVTIAFKSADDYNATNNCSFSSNFGVSYSNASVLNNTLTRVLATNMSAGNYFVAGNCSDTAGLFGNASLSFEVKNRLFINQTIIQPLVCPSDSVPNSILFVFIGLSLFMMIGLNEIFIRIPIINSIIGIGAVMYGFTLIGCSAVIGVVFIIFGLFAMIASFVRSF